MSKWSFLAAHRLWPQWPKSFRNMYEIITLNPVRDLAK